MFVCALTISGSNHRKVMTCLPLERGPWCLRNRVEREDVIFIVYAFVPGTGEEEAFLKGWTKTGIGRDRKEKGDRKKSIFD